jgi:peptidoglycan hydrolase-like protein with peptidoglycan-binding domain
MFKKLSYGLIPAVLLCAGALVAGFPAQAVAAPLSGTCDWVASYAGAWVPMNLASNSVDCFMARGAHSAVVQKLQHSMNLCYGEHLAEDSDFGPLTEAALTRTQRKVGTTPDGVYGPNTRRAMLHQAINGGCIRVP